MLSTTMMSQVPRFPWIENWKSLAIAPCFQAAKEDAVTPATPLTAWSRRFISGNLRSTSGMFSLTMTVSAGSKPRSVVLTARNSRRITPELTKSPIEMANCSITIPSLSLLDEGVRWPLSTFAVVAEDR